jgi:guanylate kinase
MFLAPPSLEEAQRRLDVRDTETETELRLRADAAATEMAATATADYVVVNRTGELESTARRVAEIIARESGRRHD